MDLVMYEFDFLNRNVRVTELNIVLAVNYFSNFFSLAKSNASMGNRCR